jgi:hypothetical protein
MAVAWRVSEPEEADPICLMDSSLVEAEAAVAVMEDMGIRCKFAKRGLEARVGCTVKHGRWHFYEETYELCKLVKGHREKGFGTISAPKCQMDGDTLLKVR